MISSDVTQALRAMTQIWRLFTGFYIPGTSVTPAMLLFFPIYVGLIVKFIHWLLSLNGPSNGGDNVKK